MTRAQTMATVLATVIMIVAFPASGADFYETQLRLGTESFSAGRLPEAIDYFRIANFGFLEKPVFLTEGLARLALAESAAGRKEELQKTLSRFLSIERQFPSYAKAALSPDERGSFEKVLLATMPKESIVSVPSLAAIAPSLEREVAEMTPAQRQRYLEAKAKAEPSNPEWPLALARQMREQGNDKAALKWTDKALRADPASPEAHAMRLSIFTSRKNDSKALAELRAMPDEAWSEIPGIVADAFVVFTRSKNEAQADALATRISGADLERADVAAAMEYWRARTASAASADATSAGTPGGGRGAADPNAFAPPPATPVDGGPDALDAAAAARGSFTGSQDRIAVALDNAKRLVNGNQPAAAQKVLRDELRKTPGSRELRLAMLEASCLARDWNTGAAQISIVEPFRSAEDRYRFYAAVVLFESGRVAEAKPLLAEAVPRLAPNPFVDHYVKLILGGE